MDKVIALEQYKIQYPGSLDYGLTAEGGDVIYSALGKMRDGDLITFTFANEAVTVKAIQPRRDSARIDRIMYPSMATEVTYNRTSDAQRDIWYECRNMVHQVSCRQEGRRH